MAIRTNPFLDDHLLRHAPRADGQNGQTDWTDIVCDPSISSYHRVLTCHLIILYNMRIGYRLRMGDCLLLETFPDFFALHRNSSSFALVREVIIISACDISAVSFMYDV